MFTGLIETVGHVSGLVSVPSGFRMRVRTPLASELALGESVAVNGVCLTVTAVEGDELQADIGPETARVTTLGSLKPQQPVNLERSLRAGDRFGGHFVQGHVDSVGTIENVRRDGDAHWLTISFPGALATALIPKGSVAVDGISLTVAALRERQFDVMIIPFTWSHTNLSSVSVRDQVNLECDMLGKYVVRAAELFEKTKL
ncbi:MAG TPA: riboflavin synthase [Vicinamibacterales bacterium]|jgi:riboflavin synthase|nr:riboflavin synthase [Vicinamibacterales bacterium]